MAKTDIVHGIGRELMCIPIRGVLERYVACIICTHGKCMETEMKLISYPIASLAVVLVVALFLPRTAEANITLSQRGCQSYASWSGNLVWARDLGADKEKARGELVALDQKTPSSIYALMLRNLESLWTTSANWESVTLLILQDCINRRGMYETAT